MICYVVKNKPVAVRKEKAATAPIVNILPVGSKFFVTKTEAGWLKLHNGFYVFETDNVALDVFDKKIVDMVKMKTANHGGETHEDFKLALQLFAPAAPAAPPYQTTVQVPTGPMNTPQGLGKSATIEEEANQSTNDQSKNTTENPEADAQSSGKILNDKYSGKMCRLDKGAYVFATDGNGNVRKDSSGNPIRWTYNEFIAAYPDSKLFEENSTCAVASIDSEGIARVTETSGNVFIVDAEHLSVNMNTNAETGQEEQWERVTLTEEAYQARAEEELKRTLETALGKDISGVVDKIMSINKIDTHMTTRIFGYPYQFLPWVDNRIGSEDPDLNRSNPMNVGALGRKFFEKIVTRAPIFTIRAGVPQFMKGYGGVDKAKVLQTLSGVAGIFSNKMKSLSEILESDGKYYSFHPATHSYFVAVNQVLRYIAVLLNIGDIELPAFTSMSSEDEMRDVNKAATYQKLADMNWEFMVQHPFSGAYEGAVYFYINSDAQVSESFSNMTRQSEIAGKVNSISDRAAEIQFLAGGVMGAVGASGLTSGLGEMGEGMINSIKNSGLEGNTLIPGVNSSGAGIFNSLIKNLSTMVAGSKMIFPEIWADSNFARAYNVTIKLVSPDSDRLSIFLNIFVPLIHILGFVLPRSTASNAYASPFLVQCWYKSMFHIDMGMITSCDIVKGETGQWSEDGLPTQVTVQLQIKDLYNVLSQASGSNGNQILSNPAQMDYIANLCGVNIGATDIVRTVTLWKTLMFNGIEDDIISIPTKAARSVSRAFFNLFP